MKLRRIQRNGKIFHTPGLEKLIALKWAYYPKQSTNLMQSLSSSVHFAQKWKLHHFPFFIWCFQKIKTFIFINIYFNTFPSFLNIII